MKRESGPGGGGVEDSVEQGRGGKGLIVMIPGLTLPKGLHFFRYLKHEHMQHCVPSSVSSGLSFLPLSFVYVNGTADINRKTTKVLPSGEPLNGSRAYVEILSYFTTTNNTPDEVHELGYKMLHKLYPEVSKIYFVSGRFSYYSNRRQTKSLPLVKQNKKKQC